MTFAVRLPAIGTHAAWRSQARGLLACGIAPHEVEWSCGAQAPGLFDGRDHALALSPAGPLGFRVSPAFIALAEDVTCHSDAARFHLLYELAWRLRGRKALMDDESDPLVARLGAMRKAVRRDSHKMKAFVRFRDIGSTGARRQFAAWFEPSHHVEEKTAPFFARRFADMDWTIVTPQVTTVFDGHALSFAETTGVPAALPDDAEELWRTYYQNIFNPARVKKHAMLAQMPQKYWRNLPEAELIPNLLATAQDRVAAMQALGPSLPPVHAARIKAPAAAGATAAGAAPASLEEMRQQVATCRRCPLYQNATQAVMGQGPESPRLMLVGEQPGDQEDLAGRPFVGPAGQLLQRVLLDAGIDMDRVYVTNTVKHFKHEARGKLRLHKTPSAAEVKVCRWWLSHEVRLVRPRLVVALGATATAALTGSGDSLMTRRGKLERGVDGQDVFITVHPASILRAPAESRIAAQAQLRNDLEQAKRISESL